MRLGGDSVSVVVRSPRSEMKASPWEIEDAEREGIPMFENHVPVEFVHDNGKLTGIKFEKVRAVYDSSGKRSLVPTGEDHVLFECDDVLIAVGQENAFPWIERDVGVDFGKWDMPAVDEATFQSSNPKVFFGGDAAFGPKNVITAVAQGHQAAVSMDLFLRGEDVRKRPAPGVTLISQKMGVHEWSYDNKIEDDKRYKVPHAEVKVSLTDRKLEVELGFNVETAIKEAQRCLNCDVQTVFTTSRCIECDACADICPTECISFVQNEDESALRKTLRAPATNLAQDLYVSTVLPTERVLVKDENVCLHCGLCAERCPTGAWDMQKFLYQVSKAGCVS
jgi:ferredoxin